MRMDLGFVAAFIIECAAFIYYSLSMFDKKQKKHFIACASAGYAIHLVLAAFEIVWLNCSFFLILNLSLLLIFFEVKPINALFHSCIMSLLSCTGEFIVFPFNLFSELPEIDFYTSLSITLIGKSFYLSCLLLLIRLFRKSGKTHLGSPPGAIVLTPILSIIIMMFLICNKNSTLVFLLLSAINVLSVAAAMVFSSKEQYNNELKEQLLMEHSELEKYTKLKDNYDKLTEIRHDFKEHLNTISALIASDPAKAAEYINELGGKSDNAFREFSDNTLLNIILHEKLCECAKRGISMEIAPIYASLSFIRGSDTVAIFTNLINNAIEACEGTSNSCIHLSFMQSGKLLAIKLSNSCSSLPVHDGQELKTTKKDKAAHGIGMKSVKRAVKNYGGELDWSCSDGIFTVTALLKYPC